MMLTVRGASDFEWMLDHELCLARRYRRYVSLAMIKTASQVAPESLIGSTMRNTDVFFDLDESLGAILMSETDSAGSQIAVERFKEACNGIGAYFATVCYPDEQMSAQNMISAAHEHLLKVEQANVSEGIEE